MALILGSLLVAAAIATMVYFFVAPEKGHAVAGEPVLPADREAQSAGSAPEGRSPVQDGPEKPQVANLHEALLSRSRTERVVRPGIDKVNSLLSSITPEGRVKDLHRSAITAGLQQSWTRKKIATMKTVGLAAGASFGLLSFLQFGGLIGVAFGAIVFGIGFKGVDIFLEGRAKARQDEIIRALPDYTDQIAISVQAGLGFEAAIQRTASSNTGPLADEFNRLIQDVRIGSTRAAAFRALSDRIDVQDLTTFIRAVAQAERTGVSIADILNIQSDELRERRRQRAEERAMKLPVIMLIPMVTCILPPLLIVLLGPAVVQITQTGFGG